MSERVLRASDQDREEAILALTDAFADGRLDHAEFEARMTSAQGATYVHDLDPLFADLPSRTRSAEVQPPARLRGLLPHRPPMGPFLVLAVVAAALLTTGHLWVLVPLFFLGLSMARRLVWRRRAWAYAALPAPPGLHGRRPGVGQHRP